MLTHWNRFWFGNGEPGYDPMGLVRILAVGIYGWLRLRRELWEMQIARDVPPELITHNFGLQVLPVPYPLPEEWDAAFRVVMALACVLGFVGFLTRPALFVVATGALYLASGYAALNFFNHELVLTLSLLWILAVYPSGASFSVDAALRWWRQGRPAGRSWREIFSLRRPHAWGYRLVLVTLCVVYVTAGISKLRYSDGEWLSGETLSFYMSRSDSEQLYLGATWEEGLGEEWKSPVRLVDHGYGASASETSQAIAASPLLMRVIAVSTVALELGGVLLLGPPLIAALFMASAFVMHTTIGSFMGLGFVTYRLYLILLLDWPALAAVYRRIAKRDAD